MKLNIILTRYLLIFLLFAVFLLLIFVPVYAYIANFTLRNELVHITNRMEQGMSILTSVLTALDMCRISTSNDSLFAVLRSWFFTPPDQDELNGINPYTLQKLQTSIQEQLLPYSLPADSGILFPNGLAVTRNNISFYTHSVPFYGTFLQCGDLTLEEWYKTLTSGGSFLPAMPYTSAYFGDYEAVTYTGIWTYIGYPEQAVFLAALPVDGITALLAETDVRPAGIQQTGINVFSGFKRIYTDLADRISTEENRTVIYSSSPQLRPSQPEAGWRRIRHSGGTGFLHWRLLPAGGTLP